LQTLTLNINGRNHTVVAAGRNLPLLWLLRDLVGMASGSRNCGAEGCGECTVLIDGAAEHSCVYDLGTAEGKKIVTLGTGSRRGTRSVPKVRGARAAGPSCDDIQAGVMRTCLSALYAGLSGAEILPEAGDIRESVFFRDEGAAASRR
jgi:isoquinoline 1-oxidoreductase alpha subunit